MKTRFSEINLIEELDTPRYEAVRKHLSSRTFLAGSVMFFPRDEQNQVFIVKKGRVRVYLAQDDREITLALLDPGDIYTTHTSAHVAALEDVEILTMDTTTFHNNMSQYPELAHIIIYVLGGMLKQSFAIIDSLAFKDIQSRFADFMYYQALQYGKQYPDGTLVEIRLTTDQIASIIGATRQSVSTTMNTMIRNGTLIKQDRITFLIPDMERLKSTA